MGDPLDVARVRGLFPGLADGYAHLDGAAGTLLPESVAHAISTAVRLPIAPLGGVFTASGRAEVLTTAPRSAVADLVGGLPSGVVLGPSMTTLTWHFARALARTWRPGDEVVVSRLDHDANVRPWVELAERTGATVRWAEVDIETGELPAWQYDDLLNRRTRLVALTAASNAIGTRPDVPAITARAHEVGALVLLDTYQSAGTVPIDVDALGVDLMVGGSVKWLLGGPGTGYLYARQEVAAGLAPRLVGWFGHEAPFAFRPSPIAFAAGAGRFVTGTPNVAAHLMAAEGYRLIAEAGVDAIRAKSRRQVARLLEGFLAQGAVVRGPADPAARGGSVVVDFDGAEQATAELIARGFTCDYRPGAGLRLGPHLYTGDDECDAVVAEVAGIRAGR